MARQKRNYEMGYLPKIAYHMASNNHEAVYHFTERQIVRYGDIKCEDMVFISKEVARIQRMWKQEEREMRLHVG